MEYIVTYTGEEFTPLDPDIEKIRIEDIAHALSLLCRANGHLDRFFSIAQHCINCAAEAKAREYNTRVQLVCLIHDASEAYISDITRPVKYYLSEYKTIEKRLQDVIYTKFLGSPLSEEDFALMHQIDNDMLIWEFDTLMTKTKIYNTVPKLASKPIYECSDFEQVENTFLKVYYGIMHAGLIQGR